ncbi:hypothetical protein ACQJBY_061181 [Aegilops geniculata]
MYPVIICAGGRKTLWLGEEVAVLLQKVLQDPNDACREHERTLPLQLVLLQLRVTVRTHRHRRGARQEMYPVIICAGGRKTLWLGEEVAVLLQKVLQERMLSLGGGHGQLKLRWYGRGAPNAVPPNAAAQAPEGHRQRVEVPKNVTEGPQEVDAKDEVEAAQVDARTGHGEVFPADGDGYVPCEAMAPEAIAVGHRDPKLLPACRLKR